MPQRIRPKYGIDPVQKVLPFSFSDDQKIHLLNELGLVNGDSAEITTQLERCARDYLWLRKQNEEKPSRAERNAVLQEIDKLARDLNVRLRGLDMETTWDLLIEHRWIYQQNPTDPITAHAERLEVLAQAAERLLRAGKQKSGPRIQTHVQRTVAGLADLYEGVTGQRALPAARRSTDRSERAGTIKDRKALRKNKNRARLRWTAI